MEVMQWIIIQLRDTLYALLATTGKAIIRTDSSLGKFHIIIQQTFIEYIGKHSALFADLWSLGKYVRSEIGNSTQAKTNNR